MDLYNRMVFPTFLIPIDIKFAFLITGIGSEQLDVYANSYSNFKTFTISLSDDMACANHVE